MLPLLTVNPEEWLQPLVFAECAHGRLPLGTSRAQGLRSSSTSTLPSSFYNGYVPSVLTVANRRVPAWERYAARLLRLWHLCSLDAPTLAVVWLLALARQAGVPARPAQIALLALGTWVVYVLDRVLDGRPGGAQMALQERHHFHRRHRVLLLSLSGLAMALMAALCCRIGMRLLVFYFALGVPVIIYAVLVHAPFLRTRRARGSGKEGAVAALFAAAVCAPVFAAAPASGRFTLGVASCLFALLCWLNCALISFAESPLPPLRTRPRLARAAIGLACMAAFSCLASSRHGNFGGLGELSAAVLLASWLLLMLLGLDRTPSYARRVRVLADLALLTPLLFLLHHG